MYLKGTSLLYSHIIKSRASCLVGTRLLGIDPQLWGGQLTKVTVELLNIAVGIERERAGGGEEKDESGGREKWRDSERDGRRNHF